MKKNNKKFSTFLFKIIVNFFKQKMCQSNLNSISITKIEYIKNNKYIKIFFISTELVLNFNNVIINKYLIFLNKEFNLKKCIQLKKIFGYYPEFIFNCDIKLINSLIFNEKFFLKKK